MVVADLIKYINVYVYNGKIDFSSNNQWDNKYFKMGVLSVVSSQFIISENIWR